MIIKKVIKCKECQNYVSIYIKEGYNPRNLTIKCKCECIINSTFENPLSPWMHK